MAPEAGVVVVAGSDPALQNSLALRNLQKTVTTIVYLFAAALAPAVTPLRDEPVDGVLSALYSSGWSSCPWML